jgi:parallel beta-helix repeat protein
VKRTPKGEHRLGPVVPAVERLERRTLCAVFVVTTTADGGAGTLRQAIADANRAAGLDSIHFAIGSGVKTISPRTSLPTLTDPVVLDATTQPGYAGRPLIELSGAEAGTTSSVSGLTVSAGGSTVRGFVINRFSANGIAVTGRGGNTVAGNWIGTDATGTSAAPNAGQGVFVQSNANVIGGLVASDRNVISGNVKNGVQLYTTATGNHVRGNYIGTNAAGSAAVPNQKCGVSIYAARGNVIGGLRATARNVISGNSADGVLIASDGASGNKVLGNYIGTDATGTRPVGNLLYGVEVSQPDNFIGGPTSAARNVISGNAKSGVALYLATATGNRVLGNFIGTDRSGLRAVGNGGRGVDVTNGPSGNYVGGTTFASRNVISGNHDGGVGVYSGSARNYFRGNYIGTDANGARAVPNSGAGIALSAAVGAGNVIGGATAGAANVIAGNAGDGVRVGESSGTVIEGNRIGTDRSGTRAVPNVLNGVLFTGSTDSVVRGNTIAHNRQHGVHVAAGTRNCIETNSIRDNGGMGINLEWDSAVTENDAADSDSGANGRQNFPVIASASLSAAGLTFVAGTLTGRAGEAFRVELFAAAAADANGHGEGGTFLGVINVTTNALGLATFTATFTAPPAGQTYITATATSAAGDTSEFSRSVRIALA